MGWDLEALKGLGFIFPHPPKDTKRKEKSYGTVEVHRFFFWSSSLKDVYYCCVTFPTKPIIEKKHRSATGWFTLKPPNLFPGECPRRLFDSDRFFFLFFFLFCTRLLCALAKTSPFFLLIFRMIFRQLTFIFRKM